MGKAHGYSAALLLLFFVACSGSTLEGVDGAVDTILFDQERHDTRGAPDRGATDSTVDMSSRRDVNAPPSPDSYQPPAHDTLAQPGDLGAACTVNEDCVSGICATNTHTGAKFCTAICDPCAAQPCAVGYGCQNAGMAYICAPGYADAPCN